MSDTVLEKFLTEAEKQAKSFESSEKELLQHLRDLGYLKVEFIADFNFQAKIGAAKKLFMNELKQSQLLQFNDLLYYQTFFGTDYIIELLRKATDIDEGFLLPVLPKLGEQSLLSRIIHYRLDIMGMYDRDVALPFSEYSKIMLQQLKTSCGFISALDTINELANIEQFTKRLLKKHGSENCLLVCKTELSEAQKDKLKPGLAFKTQLKKDFGKKSAFYDLLNEKALRRNEKNIDYGFLESQSNSLLNQLFIRLIQIHQWKDGFYDGLLDTEMGPVMLNSILELTTAFNDDKESESVKDKVVVAYVGKQYLLFNALFFLRNYIFQDKKELSQLQVIEQLNQQLQLADQKTQEQFATNSEKLLNEAQTELKNENYQAKNGTLKRVYYGIKGFFKKLFRIGKKLFQWIVKNLKKAARFLKNFFKSMLQHMKRALQCFVNGVRFILGKGAVISQSNRQLLISKFSIDMDSFHILPYKPIEADLQNHQQKVKESVVGLQFSLSVVSKLLKLVLNMANMATWPVLLINLVKVFKDLTAQYNELQFELKPI